MQQPIQVGWAINHRCRCEEIDVVCIQCADGVVSVGPCALYLLRLVQDNTIKDSGQIITPLSKYLAVDDILVSVEILLSGILLWLSALDSFL